MTEGYYCGKCQKFVLAVLGLFQHLHTGEQTCYRCRKCGEMVYLKIQEENDGNREEQKVSG